MVKQWIPESLQISAKVSGHPPQHSLQSATTLLPCPNQEYDSLRRSETPHVLLDVREKAQFDMVRLPGAVGVMLHRSLSH